MKAARFFLFAALSALLLSPAWADTITVDNSASGYVYKFESVTCYGSTSGNGNYLAGYAYGQNHINYFVFDLTSVTDTITDATLTVANYTVSKDGTYSVYTTDLDYSEISAKTATYSEFTSGTIIGSVTVTTSDSGSSSVLALTADGLAWLNSNIGSVVVISGSSTGTTFASSYYSPTNAVLTLTTSEVPEPSSVLLLGSGLFGILGLCRKFRG